MRRLALLLTLAVPACAQVYWTKPGFSPADWQRDRYECERDARMSVLSFGTGIVGALNEQDFFNRCLVAHGYYQVQATPARASQTNVQQDGSLDPCHDAPDLTKCMEGRGKHWDGFRWVGPDGTY
jgi:hypothetical protein